jgi:hypothetical protein
VNDPKGLYKKYRVIEVATGEEVEEPTFTFKLQSDQYAIAPMMAYAEAIKDVNPKLYTDILRFFD